ncbi:unnamed protein product [Heligmosomoides polygyrus]|uniref:DUF4210 domain-containing protein n=1 Tax=Heligmosomoides polygyrus TaxID=6339 RepID=A0A183FHR6_HELPZ|nr:unnamed protein product [Heligmosomoides polygyrus]
MSETRTSLSGVEDECGLFEVINFDDKAMKLPASTGAWSDNVAILSHLVPKALARSGVESSSFPDSLRQFLDAIMVELEHNMPTSFVHDFICFESVNTIQNSLNMSLLPTADILSRFFHEIAKPEYGREFDSADAVYRLLMYFLHQYPPCNAEGRFYWLQVLTTPSPYVDDPPVPARRRDSALRERNLMSRVTDFRRMILETFTEDGINHSLMELLVCVLETDLFNMEGCDGLDTSKDTLEDGGYADRSSHSVRSEDLSLLTEKPQDSSALEGVPLSYLVFYDPYERRKRGLDKTAMETCFRIVDIATSTDSVVGAGMCWRLLSVCLEGLQLCLAERMRLFRREQISVDLQIDVERLGRYLIKRGLSHEEIAEFIRVGWLCDIITAMK